MKKNDYLPKELSEINLVRSTSAAYITWMLHYDHEAMALRDKYAAEREETEIDYQDREIIKRLNNPEDFFKWMRKPLRGKNKFLLRDVMLNREDEITPMVRDKIQTSWIDDFVECVIDFFIECNNDPSPWIRENYDNVRNPYAQSELCLVLGFRGGEEDSAFLVNEAKRFVAEYPENDYEQGPIIALYMIHGYDHYMRDLDAI